MFGQEGNVLHKETFRVHNLFTRFLDLYTKCRNFNFRHIYKSWKENLLLKWNVFLPDVCQLRSRVKGCSFTFLNVNFFSPNCSTSAVKCD